MHCIYPSGVSNECLKCSSRSLASGSTRYSLFLSNVHPQVSLLSSPPHRSHSVSGLTKACPGHTPSSPWPKTWDKSPRRFLLLYPFAAISTSLLGPTNLSPLRAMKTKADGCCNKLLRCCSYLLHSRKKKKKRHKVMLVFLTGSAEHFPLPSNMYNSYFLGKLLSSKIQLMVSPLWSLQN